MLITGSRVKVGFAYDIWNPGGGYTSPDADDDTVYMRDVIEGGMYDTGEFSDVVVSITPSQYLGVQDGYILIEATTAVDKGRAEDVGSLAQGVIQGSLPAVRITRRDATKIIYVPQSAAGNPNIEQPNDRTNTPPTPDQCSGLAFGDWLACETGFTKSTSLLLGVAVTLGVLFAISRR